MPEVDPKTSEAITSANDVRPSFTTGSQPAPDAPAMSPAAGPQTAPQIGAAVAPPAPPPVVATSKNPALHNLIGSVLGGLAGHPAPRYSYDESGKLITSAAAPESSSDKIRRIASNALTGLSAGGGPEKKSGLANLLTGAGQGAEAVQEKTQGQDILRRAQAKEAYETEQQNKLRQHEIARQNALTLSTYYGAKKAANDMGPHFAQNESLFNSVKASPELGAHATEMSDTQVEQEAAKDPTFAHTHIIKPLGWAPETDANGQQVMVDGAPKFYMRMAVIDGTKDGKIRITPELASDFQKYGPMARVPNAADLKAGDEYDLANLLPAMNKVDEQRKAVLDGWQKSELGWITNKDGSESPVETNKVMPPGMADRTRPLTVQPMAMKAEEAKSDQETAAAEKDRADAKKALAEAALTASLVGANGGQAIPAYMDAISRLPQTSQAILRNVSPAEQLSILKVANGDADLNKVFPTRTTKGSGQLDASRATTLVSLLNRNWTQQIYATKQKALSDFATGEDGKAIASFNQFLVHADDARIGSERLARTNSPWLNEPINKIRSKGMGDPGVPGLMTDIFAARNEWQNFIKNGHAADLADSEQGRQIMSDASSPAQVMKALQEMGKQAIGRLDQIDSKWRRTWGGHYPGIVSDTGRTAANNLGLGDQIKMYPSESGAFGGVSPNQGQMQSPDNPSQRPNGATGIAPGSDGKMYYHDIKGNILGPAPASVQ